MHNNRVAATGAKGESAGLQTGFNGEMGWEQDQDSGITELKGAGLAAARRDSDFHQSIRLRELYPTIAFKGGIKLGSRAPW